MTVKMTARGLALVVAGALAAAACGGDDDDAASSDTASADPATVDGDTGETGDTGDTGETGDSGDDAGDDAGVDDGAASPTGEPSTLLADELHPLELPDPGTAVVTLAGETYVFDELNSCGITETLPGRWSFVAIGNGELADGTRTRFDVSRYIVEPGEVAEGVWHERDFLQMTVEQDPGEGMYSNAIHDVHRKEVGGPVEGDGDVLPLVRVVDDGGVVAATAVAEVSHPPFTGEFDRAGEGLGEFAVNCG